jgi:hypothetical protein
VLAHAWHGTRTGSPPFGTLLLGTLGILGLAMPQDNIIKLLADVVLERSPSVSVCAWKDVPSLQTDVRSTAWDFAGSLLLPVLVTPVRHRL